MLFFVPNKWSVLIVEDTAERRAWFKERMPQAVFATTAGEALLHLSRTKFQAVFLDHDLHWMHASDNSISKGTGKEVARYLKMLGFRGVVVIHSKNEEGAAVMHQILPDAKVAPYGTFEVTYGQPREKGSDQSVCTGEQYGRVQSTGR